MAQVNYQPHLLIGVGYHNHYFTLRESHESYVPGAGPYGNAVVNGVYQGTVQIGYHHVQNLSQDPAEAYAKAVELAKERGMQLWCNGPEELGAARDAINRADEAELVARALKLARDEELYHAHLMADDYAEQILLNMELADGFIAKRRYRSAHWSLLELYREAYEYRERSDPKYGVLTPSRDYDHLINLNDEDSVKRNVGWIEWFLGLYDAGEFAEQADQIFRAEALIARGLRPAKAHPSKLLGEVGQRVTVEAQIRRIHVLEDAYGQKDMVTLVTSDGIQLVNFNTGKRYGETGDTVKIKATVKRHGEYKGQAQTTIARVAVV